MQARSDTAILPRGITAHRGNSAQYPENTLRAFAAGLACGADWIELDVRLTTDHRLVVIHDETTGRTAGVDLPVAATSYAQLRTLDMAREFRKKNGLSSETCPPQRIPLLSEVLELAKRCRRARVSIQPKADCVGEIVEQIRTLNAEDRIGFNDGSREKMAEARRQLPAAPIFLDTSPNGPPLADSIAFARDRGFETIVMNRAEVTAQSVRLVKSAGLQAGAWTVNNLEEARRFDALGIDRFYTDMPVTLLFGLDRQPPRSH